MSAAMTTTATRYTVHGIAEEFECPACGMVVESGDTAYDLGFNVACSRACAESLESPRRGYGHLSNHGHS